MIVTVANVPQADRQKDLPDLQIGRPIVSSCFHTHYLRI